MAFKKLTLSNFQSHKESVLDLSPTVNSIEGCSDAGKSAILRGLLWCLTNKPDGQQIVRNGEDTCSVALDDLTRKRGRKTGQFNGYIHGTAKYEALKGGVPTEIENLLNVGDVNIHRQMDAAFLLTMSAGDRARYVNDMVGLQDIDKYQKALKSMAKDTGADLKRCEDELAESIKACESYVWLTDAKAKVSDLQEVTNTFNTLSSDVDYLSKLDALTELDSRIGSLELVVAKATKAIDSFPDVVTLAYDCTLLERVVSIDDERIGTLGSILTQVEPIISDMDSINVSSLIMECDALQILDSISDMTIRIEAITATIARTAPVIAELETLATSLPETENFVVTVNTLESLYSKAGAIIKEQGDLNTYLSTQVCPTCGKPLGEHHV